MDIPVRPTKRRNTRKDHPLLEGDLEVADEVTVEHVKVATRRGTVVKAVLAPVDPLRAETTGDRVGDRVLPTQDVMDALSFFLLLPSFLLPFLRTYLHIATFPFFVSFPCHGRPQTARAVDQLPY